MKIRKSAVALLTVLLARARAPTRRSGIHFTALADAAKEKLAEQTAIEKLLNDQLPLALNANDVYPAVTESSRRPLQPNSRSSSRLTQLRSAARSRRLHHQHARFLFGVFSPRTRLWRRLRPRSLRGQSHAGAIGALIWRGTVQYHINPNYASKPSHWAIQSGLTYSQMPKSYQAIVDRVIPDLQNREISSDFFAKP